MTAPPDRLPFSSVNHGKYPASGSRSPHAAFHSSFEHAQIRNFHRPWGRPNTAPVGPSAACRKPATLGAQFAPLHG